MRPTELLRSACVTVLAIVTGPGIAQARDVVRASEHAEELVMARGGDDGAVLWRLSGGAVTRSELPETVIHDAAFAPDGHLWVLVGSESRNVDVELRDLDSGTSLTVAGCASYSQPRLASRGSMMVVVSPAGVWRREGERVVSVAAWRVDDYGFYAATTWLAADGSVHVLVPRFDTCGSSDVLESAVVARAGPGGSGSTPLRTRGLDWPPSLGAGGVRYAVRARGASSELLALTATDERTLEVARHRRSALIVASDTHHTVAVWDDRVVRIARGRTVRLGQLPRGFEDLVQLAVDRRGRALALLEDGALWRFSRSSAPERLLRAEP